MRKVAVAVAVCWWLGQGAGAQTVRSWTIQVSAAVQAAPPSITLTWQPQTGATGYRVYRKEKAERTWGGLLAQPPASATQYVDTNVQVGKGYEYRIEEAGGYQAVGFIYCGIELPAVESRGKVILLVESGQATALTAELLRLQYDLIGDGWQVIRHDVAATVPVPEVRAIIQTDYQADPNNVRAVFIIGHVAVPYSGNMYPDGHTQHQGAWPADALYADVDGVYTDATVQVTSGSDSRQWNIPGDGKYDRNVLASDAELEVGRVDLRNLPGFTGLTETDLLRRYLNKDHYFRHKSIDVPERGLIQDNFGVYNGNYAFSRPTYGDFAAMFGTDGVVEGTYLGMLQGGYLWSYGCGPGSYTRASGILQSSDFANASNTFKSMFTLLFGSYFGDWDTSNNLMRSALASKGYLLTCAWSGDAYWYFHHMALGETIGYSNKLSQNNGGTYVTGYNTRFVFMGLMGDPTLRMHVVAPPVRLQATATGGAQIRLDWAAPTSGDEVMGYYVYRATAAEGPFTRISPDIVRGTSFTDTVPSGPADIYMVRAVAVQQSGSGTYYNLSQGVFSTDASQSLFPIENRTTGARYRLIQDAVSYAGAGDEIVVPPGICTEAIDLSNKDVRLRSCDPNSSACVAATILQGSGQGPVVKFVDNTSQCELAGLTIRGGGAGIACVSGGPTIRSCRIVGNAGSGMELRDMTQPLIEHCVIAANGASGINMVLPSSRGATPTLTHCTIAENGANGIAGGRPIVSNSILYYNGPQSAGPQITAATASVTHSCVGGGCIGAGNIDAAPLFAHRAPEGDYHLQSVAGRWDSLSGQWVADAVSSPCIDVGTPSADFSAEPIPNGGCVNMGAYGATAEASKSPL